MALPSLTPEERKAALDKAAVARKRRAAIKDDLKAGKIRLSKVLELAKDDPVIAKLKVTSLLQSLPGVGPAKCEAIMEQARIAPSRRVAGLGKHQFAKLIDMFG
ncbi:integration host factor, actinobacterial type [Trueperella pecoris]|uniref:Integration host factor n=1 Tax=Trueperella pecoris TaxID=2733571 RepID=A0A7M1QWQ3_9ACTO|nr:integration host factor, actinobacterial type [Trueperella pecoris]QOQ38852.1 integration host factor [Trueperella pecoris]QOR46522.1 integration host factor [Trueperella pecoris]QTG76348.1 integration host factor MihF [Trueperella pecoris]